MHAPGTTETLDNTIKRYGHNYYYTCKKFDDSYSPCELNFLCWFLDELLGLHVLQGLCLLAVNGRNVVPGNQPALMCPPSWGHLQVHCGQYEWSHEYTQWWLFHGLVTYSQRSPTCVHESPQVQCIWPGHYHVTAMASMHWTCSDSCTHVGPPLTYSLFFWVHAWQCLSMGVITLDLGTNSNVTISVEIKLCFHS